MDSKTIVIIVSITGLLVSLGGLCLSCNETDIVEPTIDEVAENFLVEIGYPEEMEAHCASAPNFSTYTCLAWLGDQPQFSFFCDDNLFFLTIEDKKSCSLTSDVRSAF